MQTDGIYTTRKVPQSYFFESVGMLSLLKHVLSGGTGSVIGVGGKWSGKSSAIVGRDDVVGAVGYGEEVQDTDGLLPRAITALFDENQRNRIHNETVARSNAEKRPIHRFRVSAVSVGGRKGTVQDARC